MAKILGIGLACLDYLLQVPDLQSVQQGCLLQSFKAQGGGMAATAMVTVVRLGGEAELWTVIGDDDEGRRIEAELLAEGVDLSQLIRTDRYPSQVTFVLVDGQTGERAFLSSGISLRTRFLPFEPAPDLSYLDKADVVLVDGLYHQWAINGLKRARAQGIPTCGDIEYLTGNEALLEFIDYLVVPREMAEEMTGSAGPEALNPLAAFGAKMVVITLGAEGCLYLVDGEIGSWPAFAVEAVDTTGAGDVFHGAFVYGLAQGWSPRQLVLFSSAVAALKCTHLGGRTGIPDLAQTRRFLAERLPEEDLAWL